MASPTGNTKTYKYYFNYGKDTSDEARKSIKETFSMLAKRARKNTHIFQDLKINVCSSEKDLVTNTPFSEYCKSSDALDDAMGVAIDPLCNNNIKEIILQTEDPYSTFLGSKVLGSFFRKELPEETLRGNALHEFGHIFDFYFGKQDKELRDKYTELGANCLTDSKDAEGIIDKVIQSDGLRNTKEFKEAWREDVNKIGQLSEIEQENLGYLKPNLQSEIDISDGVDDKELELAEVERGEAFAQLFSYALSPGKNIHYYDKESILKAYPKTMQVVKSYITEFFGISFNYVPKGQAKK